MVERRKEGSLSKRSDANRAKFEVHVDCLKSLLREGELAPVVHAGKSKEEFFSNQSFRYLLASANPLRKLRAREFEKSAAFASQQALLQKLDAIDLMSMSELERSRYFVVVELLRAVEFVNRERDVAIRLTLLVQFKSAMTRIINSRDEQLSRARAVLTQALASLVGMPESVLSCIMHIVGLLEFIMNFPSTNTPPHFDRTAPGVTYEQIKTEWIKIQRRGNTGYTVKTKSIINKINKASKDKEKPFPKPISAKDTLPYTFASNEVQDWFRDVYSIELSFQEE